MSARRPVAFVKYYDKGSTDISGEQIAAGLQARGHQARTVYASELAGLRDHVLIFIKTSRLDHLLAARARGCTLVLDVHDTVVFKRRIKNRWLFDALIFKNRRQQADFGRPGKADCLIYHQWDKRYRPNEASPDALSVAFIGDRRSFDLWGDLPGVECVAPGRWFESAPRFNVHLSVRRSGREMLYKPNLKVSTAAVCRAVLLTTRDESSVELLGDDYPFYCAPSREGVIEGLNALRAAWGSAQVGRALDILATVREVTALDRILDGYEALLDELARRREAR